MEQKKSGGTHTVMPKKLAEALMEAGMHHFDSGGVAPTQSFGNQTSQTLGFSPWMQQQANQVDALQGMNLYNAQAPNIQTQNFTPQIAGTRQAQANTYQAQNNLAQQLLAQSQGRGPNIAQTQLANATGQNVSAQGALMASQRGANANPALMARQAAMQGGALQQQAAGQSAALQAQQQIAAQQGLQGLYANQAQNALSAEQIQQQALANQNQAINQGSLGAQTINANASGQNAQRVGSMQSGFTNALGGMMSLFADGGTVGPSLTPYQSLASDPIKIGPSLPGKSDSSDPATSQRAGTQFASPQGYACGGFANYLAGGSIPGQAPVQGDSKKNDNVPALLSPGEIVLPRSVTQGPNMEAKAIEFLRHLKGAQKKGYGGVIEAKKGKC